MRTEIGLEILNHHFNGNGERYVDINRRMLEEGEDFETASEFVAGRNLGTQGLRTFSRQELIVENRENFKKIGADELTPYRRIMEAMDAKTRRKSSRVEQEVVVVDGRRQIIEKVVTYYEEVDDWATILQAVRQFCQLYGLDPKAGLLRVEGMNTGTVNFNMGNILNMTKYITNDDDRLAFYNEYKRMQRLGMLPKAIEGEVIDVEVEAEGESGGGGVEVQGEP